MSRVLIGDAVRSGSTGLIMWNLALDTDHGPKLPGGCDDCRGLLTVDASTGAITRSPEFWVLAHLSAASDPGAVVLATDRIDGLPVAVFRNPDGTIGVFGHNDRPSPVEVTVEIDGMPEWHAEIPSWGVFSARG
jgi:glucosylceramidase